MALPSCPLCEAVADPPFVELCGVPVNPNMLWPTREAATSASRGDVLLSFCERCGMIWNVAFDPDALEYTEDYDNSLHFSPAFRRYAETLADRLIERHDVRKKTVVEIGCGKGEFLSLLCERGDNDGIGFDPSYNGESDDHANGRVRVDRRLYTEETASGDGDLIVFRHVLEHIPDPLGFLRTVRRTVGSRDAVVYCEVPAAEYLLREHAVWDIIYSHCSIFGARSLAYLFERAGFVVLDVGFSFSDQYLWLEALPSGEGAQDQRASSLAPLVASFGEVVREKQALWSRGLARSNGASTAIWGAGAKGTTFLNLVEGTERVTAVIDVNPRKHGKYVPGTGHMIVPPEVIAEHAPTKVVVMNPVYRDEIEASLHELGLAPEVVCV